MAATPFPYSAMISQSSQMSRVYPTLSVVFADGRYEQRARDGLTPVVRKFDWVFENRTQTDYQNLMAFFDTCGKIVPFSWTPPGSTQPGNFVVDKEPSASYPSGAHFTVRVSVREVFNV